MGSVGRGAHWAVYAAQPFAPGRLRDSCVVPLTRAEIAKLSDSVRQLLADPDARLSRDARLRWEGALTALETVLGQAPTLGRDGLDLTLL